MERIQRLRPHLGRSAVSRGVGSRARHCNGKLPSILWGSVSAESVLQICACAPAMRPLFSNAFARGSGLSTTISRGYLSRTKGALTGSTLLSTFSEQSRSDKVKPTDSTSEVSPWGSLTRLYDIEGIATEGYGYKVTISADPNAHLEDRARLRKKWYNTKRAGTPDGALKSDGGIIAPKTGLLAGTAPRKESLSHREKAGKVKNMEEALRVHTTQSIEVHQSFHSASHEAIQRLDNLNVQLRNGPTPSPQPNRGLPQRSLHDSGYLEPTKPKSAMQRSKSMSYSAITKPKTKKSEQKPPSSSRTQKERNASARSPVNSSQPWALRPDSWDPFKLDDKRPVKGSSWSSEVEGIMHSVGRGANDDYKPTKTF